MGYVSFVDSRCFRFVNNRVYGLFLGPYRTGRARPWNVGDRSFSSFNVDISELGESLTFSSIVFMALSWLFYIRG